MKRILFYSSVNSLELFKTQKFYQIDISILKDLGYDVLLSNRIFDSLLFWKYDILFSYFSITTGAAFSYACSRNTSWEFNGALSDGSIL